MFQLARRLHSPVFCTSGSRKYQWKHLDVRGVGYADLIDYVLDRYARRYGPVGPTQANVLQQRLASRYSAVPWSTVKVFDRRFNVYPRSLADAQLRDVWANEDAAEKSAFALKKLAADLVQEYKTPSGLYAILDGKQETCSFCGTVVRHWAVDGTGLVTEFRNGPKPGGHPWVQNVCRDPRCRAIAAYTKTWVWKSPEHTLTRLILEVIKNGKNNTYKRGLAKHFVRDAGRLHGRQDRRGTGENDRQDRRQPAQISGD